MGVTEVQGRGCLEGRRRPHAAKGSWGEGAFSSQEENLPQIWKELPAAQSSPTPGRKPLELPSAGDSELEVGIDCELLSRPLQCDCVWFGLLFLTFLLSVGWLYIGLILLNDLHNFNECVMDTPPSSAYMSTYSPPQDPGCSIIPTLPSSPVAHPP